MRLGCLWMGFVLACAAAFLPLTAAWAMDEAILTPTNSTVIASEEAKFNAAMSLWFKHEYGEGAELLKRFSREHPNNRWAAEADLHVGCYLTFLERYDEARPIFDQLISRHPGNNVATKARMRLANIAERSGKLQEAIGHYSDALVMNPTWDQFKYANYRARKLVMAKGKLQAAIDCGPVALAACLEAMGRKQDAGSAGAIKPGENGLSLLALAGEAELLNAPAQLVEMSMTELAGAELPVIAHVSPNHYVAVLGIDGASAVLEDSIRGSYEMPLAELSLIWTGRVLTFSSSTNLRPLSLVAAVETVGGCCGQADEDECLGDPVWCQQASDRGPCDDGLSLGAPTWRVNTANLNLLVRDTPIWYDSGRGPKIEFTLNYSNENSNTGVFGRGWRCQYDMKVFFLPSDIEGIPILQLHRADGRIETYCPRLPGTWQGGGAPSPSDYVYDPRPKTASYGYRDKIRLDSGSGIRPIVDLRSGGRWYFAPAGGPAEGRIQHIEDMAGGRVTCQYNPSTGNLVSIVDENSRLTTIETQGSGTDERVTMVTLPDGRHAHFGYSNGDLVSITDMLHESSSHTPTSTFTYEALAWGGPVTRTALKQAITASPLFPANGGSLMAEPIYMALFPPAGKLRVYGENGAEEVITYTRKTGHAFGGITRGVTPINASAGSNVDYAEPSTILTETVTADPLVPADGGSIEVVSTLGFPGDGKIGMTGPDRMVTEILSYTGTTDSEFTGITRGTPAFDAMAQQSTVQLCTTVPYLSTIETPSRKTKFTYEWWKLGGAERPLVALHEVYECGASEDYPAVPTRHYAWCSKWLEEAAVYCLRVTRYPIAVAQGMDGCVLEDGQHWAGGLTRAYEIEATAPYDLTTGVIDELGRYAAKFSYNSNRDLISSTDGRGHTTWHDYGTDNLRNLYSTTDPSGSRWEYTYYPVPATWIEKEKDPDGEYPRVYYYNAAGQVTKIEAELTPGVRSTLLQSFYDVRDPGATSGQLDYTIDGEGRRTDFYYNEPRGFLTSVVDSAGKTVSYSYDDKGRLRSMTEPGTGSGPQITTYDYDDLDRVTQVTYADGTYATTEYDCCHKVRTVDVNGRATRYLHDKKSRPWLIIGAAIDRALGQEVTPSTPDNSGSGTLLLDSTAGLPMSGAVFLGNSTTGAVEVITYSDITGQSLVGIKRGMFGTSAATFPTGDSATQGTIAATEYDEDIYGSGGGLVHRGIAYRRARIYDADGRATEFQYYDNDLAKRVTYVDGSYEHYTYDAAGNLTLKETVTPAGTGNAARKTTRFSYDECGRLVRMSP